AALEKAQARARTYADALGLKVRRIVSISEGGASLPRPVPMMRAMAADAMAKETSVSPGETTLSVAIDVVFELGR
ncbi:MAG TPA: SIMPL domain-containing protein, partial [Thermomonas sp.]|nr:SIMPL domain-containing protein [Thermomonas sp.]